MTGRKIQKVIKSRFKNTIGQQKVNLRIFLVYNHSTQDASP